jgi:hypothetical protein
MGLPGISVRSPVFLPSWAKKQEPLHCFILPKNIFYSLAILLRRSNFPVIEVLLSLPLYLRQKTLFSLLFSDTFSDIRTD